MRRPGSLDDQEQYSDEYMFSTDALFEVPHQKMSEPMF
jgi:hypothetical protein